jgi:hypothetical protein
MTFPLEAKCLLRTLYTGTEHPQETVLVAHAINKDIGFLTSFYMGRWLRSTQFLPRTVR